MIKSIIQWFEKHNKLSLVISILIAILIFYMSSLSFESGVPGPSWRIKPVAYHFVIFAVLTFFLLISSVKGDKKKVDLIFSVISFAILYAIRDEIH